MKSKEMIIECTMPMIQVSYKNKTKMSERVHIRSASDAIRQLREVWDEGTIELYEEFKIMYLDRRGAVIGIRELGRGSVAGVWVDIRLIFAIGISCNCSSIILCHNHPSGNLNPSEGDKKITQNIKGICELFDIDLLDHVIISSDEYYSFAEENIL